MPSQVWKAADIQGLVPALDPRRAQGVFALGGSNFAFDSLGPRSYFGNRLVSNDIFVDCPHTQGVRLHLHTGDRTFLFTGMKIREWNEATLSYATIYTTPDTTLLPYRWTYGYLNGYIFFCHPAVGILRLNVASGVCEPNIGPGVPENPLAICVDNGRLCAIDLNAFYWSIQSDGRDFTPALGGGGFQVISDRVAGTPIMLHSYSKGVLTWTTGGVMRSEYTGDSDVYRHRNINTEYRPVNSFCTAQQDDNTIIILDERGLFKSQGESPVPVTPVFNEFLIKYLQQNKLKLGQNVRLEWDNLQRFLYMSISTSFNSPLYERAFVLYPPLDKWGTFDESHYGIVPILLKQSERQGDYFGFIAADRKVRYWRPTGSRETTPGVLAPLNATLQIGLIQFDGLNDSIDQIVNVNQVIIGNAVSGPSDVVAEDFNLIPDGVSNEDYNTATGGEDLGFERLNYINHKTRMIGTTDGSTVFLDETPELVKFTAAARYYSCDVPGVWHILELKADEIGELFHMRFFRLTGVYGGTL